MKPVVFYTKYLSQTTLLCDAALIDRHLMCNTVEIGDNVPGLVRTMA